MLVKNDGDNRIIVNDEKWFAEVGDGRSPFRRRWLTIEGVVAKINAKIPEALMVWMGKTARAVPTSRALTNLPPCLSGWIATRVI